LGTERSERREGGTAGAALSTPETHEPGRDRTSNASNQTMSTHSSLVNIPSSNYVTVPVSL
jgi:hypothetical protein